MEKTPVVDLQTLIVALREVLRSETLIPIIPDALPPIIPVKRRGRDDLRLVYGRATLTKLGYDKAAQSFRDRLLIAGEITQQAYYGSPRTAPKTTILAKFIQRADMKLPTEPMPIDNGSWAEIMDVVESFELEVSTTERVQI